MKNFIVSMKVVFIVIMACFGCMEQNKIAVREGGMILSRDEKLGIISEYGNSGEINNAKFISEFLEDNDNAVIGSACFNLGYLGARDYLDKISEFLNRQDRDLLNQCVGGMALMVDVRDEYLLPKLFPLVGHEYLLIRMGAIKALGNIKSRESVKLLVDIFNDEVSAAKFEIIVALGKIGDAAALPLLLSYQKEISGMDHSVPRRAAVRGSDPHPDVLDIIVAEAIRNIEMAR